MNRHESLLRRWRSRARHDLVCDGIFDEGLWASAPTRVLFILKEAYDSDNPGKGWDLRDLARQEGFKGVTLREMSHWARALVEPTQGYPCSDDVVLHNALLSTASINVKKVPGGTYAHDKEIRDHANDYGDLLQEQIEIIDPDVIVCGSTWWAIRHLFQTSTLGDSTDRIHKAENGKVFLDFWHPANRFPRLMNCATLTELARRAKVLPSI